MFKILFLCTGSSGRSLMAESFAKRLTPKKVEVISAGDKHFLINRYALQAMNELDIKLPERVKNILSEITSDPFDIVVTLCNNANEMCPTFPGAPARIHWPLKDPSSTDPSKDTIKAFREIRDEIRLRVESLFKLGLVDTIAEIRLLFASLLNNLTDGVMAHDMDRRIFFFNKAAELITGYSSSDLVGKDCHDIFPGKFCGGDCSFCDNKVLSNTKLRYPRNFVRKTGEIRTLEMTVVTINPPKTKVTGALVIFKDLSEVVHLRKRLENSRGFNGIIGRHESMIKVFDLIQELADVKIPILIQGETGTGKEMVATALHQLSKRASGPFVPVNCGALPEGTLESELFGHVKGAFTGAIRDRKGRFELAEGGTIFLDEIGEISHAMQIKLLRVVQEKNFIPVGGEHVLDVDARIICATNKDLKLLTQQGLFREDLYYRLAVVPVNLPALKDKKSDISLLVEHFLDKYSTDIGKSVREISKDALELMMKYNWPGNVRELSNAIQYSMIKCNNGRGILEKEHLPPEILEYTKQYLPMKLGRPPKIDADTIRETLQKVSGNKAKAAKLLSISRTTLYRLIRS